MNNLSVKQKIHYLYNLLTHYFLVLADWRYYTCHVLLPLAMTLKQKIHTHYIEQANNRVKMLQQTLADLKESGSNETKSTAGDKHETALAMLQIEQTNIRGQLQNALEQQATLSTINPLLVSANIINGSLVKTNKGYFYASLALGKIVIDGITVFAVSQQSPLGEKLMGLVVGDAAQINNNKYVVEAIL